MKKISLFILISLFLLLSVSVFPAQIKAEIFPVSAGQSEAAAAYNNQDDQYFITWSECRNIPTGGNCNGNGYSCAYGSTNASDIYGQLIKGDGSCLGGNFLVSTEPVAGESTGQSLPDIAYNPNSHEYLVVWQGHRRDFVKLGDSCEGIFQKEGYDIFGQRFTSGGVRIGPQIKISNTGVTNDDQQWHPSVSFSTRDNVYLVAWHDGRTRQMFPGTTTTYKDVYGQIVKADGTPMGNSFPISLDPGNTTTQIYGNALRIQQYPSTAYDSVNNKFLVVSEDDRQGTGRSPPCGPQYDRLKTHIYGAFFDTSGHKIGNNFPISQTDEAKRYAKIAYNPHYNEYLVVWQGAQQAPALSDPCPNPLTAATAPYPNDWVKAYAQRINSNGEKIGNLILIDDTTKFHNWYYDNSYAPQIKVAVNPLDNKYLVTWGDSGAGSAFTISGKWIDPQTGSVTPAGIGSGFTIGTGAYTNLIYFDKPSGSDNYLSVQTHDYTFNSTKYRVVDFKKSTTAVANCSAQGGPPPTTPYPTAILGPPQPTNTGSPQPTPASPPTAIGQCHATNLIGQTIGNTSIKITWGYDAPFWSGLEPTQGNYNFQVIDNGVNRATGNNKVWIEVVTNTPGNDVIPQWAVDAGIKLLKCTTPPSKCDGYLAKNAAVIPWDPKYLQLLENLVQKMAEKYDNDSRVEAVIIPAGGNYGEAALPYSNCHGSTGADVHDINNYFIQEMANVTGESPTVLTQAYTSTNSSSDTGTRNFVAKFDYYYAENIKKIIDIFARHFKNKAIVYQAGSGISCQNTLSYEVADYGVKTYGKRVWLKQNGWGSGTSYDRFFSDYKTKTRVIEETGQPSFWTNQTNNDTLIRNAINSGISAVCFQSTILDNTSTYPINYQNLNAGLVQNYNTYYLNSPSITPSGPQPTPVPTINPNWIKVATINFTAKTGVSGNALLDFQLTPQSKVVEKATALDILGTLTPFSIKIGGGGTIEAPIIKFKIKFRDVPAENAANYPNQKVFLGVLKDDIGWEFPNVQVNYSGEGGIYLAENISLTGVPAGSDYILYIKGPKHLAKGFHDVTLISGNNPGFYWVDNELEPGDLPPQDGFINSLDISKIVDLLEVPSPSQDQLDVADLNYDGVINGADINSLLLTLETDFFDDWYYDL